MHTLMFEVLKVLKASFEQDTKISSYIGKIISAKHYPGTSKCEPSVDIS